VSLRVLVIGDGRMGRAVAQLAAERDCTVVATYGPVEMARGVTAGIADVAIEFTEPHAAAANVRACLAVGIPVVTGTTGWDEGLTVVRAEAVQHGGTMLHAPNFSIGVALFRKLVASAARLASALPPNTFALHLVETHHAAKLDAPSGTARMLARVAAAELGHDLPVTSVRLGSVPGTHEFVLDAPFEQIRLTHEARDRRVFAEGAVAAAKWLVGRSGVFSFDEYIAEQLGSGE
jgi:4-hydroxy-tetrahydrodipicolinate reductase